MERLQKPKSQAFGAAVAIAAILAIITFILFRDEGARYAALLGITPSWSERAGEDAVFSIPSLHTVEKRESVAPSCVEGERAGDKSTARATITLSYPHICDPVFDATMQYIVKTIQEEFLDQVDDTSVNMAPYSLSISSSHVFVNQNIASALLVVTTYTGGAHPGETLYSLSVDRTRNMRLGLADLFDMRSSYLSAIRDRAKGDLGVRLGADNIFTDGLRPIEEHYRIFTLTDKDITFHFPPYQVAAGAAGSQEVTVPFLELGEYWRAE